MNEVTKMSGAGKQLVSNNYPELFHYTSLEGLKGIMESGTLWATNARHLNDSSEFQLMWKAIQPKLEEYFNENVMRNREQYPQNQVDLKGYIAQDAQTFLQIFRNILTEELIEPHVTSFTTHEDEYNRENGLLSQWRGYGNDGVAIVFDHKKLEKLVEEEEHRFQYLACSLERAVYYNNECKLENEFPELFREMERYAGEYATNDMNGNNIDLNKELFFAVGRLKHRGFQEENEFRIMLGVPNYDRIDEFATISPLRRKEVHFRNGRCGSIPYIKVFEESGDLPITRILVGPSRNQAENEYLVKKFLQDLLPGSGIELDKSEIPFVSTA